jgi:regulator of sigma D
MLENCKTARERWGGTHQIIDRWLNQRQETLVRYFDISSDTAADQQSSLLTAFCESLMDYVSAGHFEVYEQLIREAKEFDDGGLELARTLYPKIESTTQIIVDFNDKYDTQDHTKQHVSDLPDDLSKLGEAMTERFEMEDQMIQRLHTIHKEQVA